MEFHILIGQRKCSYPQQYAPEALAVMTGAEYSDNPDYLHDTQREHKIDNEFDAVEIITLKVSTEEIEKRLFPEHAHVSAEVK